MQVAIVTVGDEVLAGDVENTNASWLAERLSSAGATVTRIITLPDQRDVIAETVADWAAAFDAVIVTGGLGGTHDDVTADALADVFDRELVVEQPVRQAVIDRLAAHRDLDPAELDLDRVPIDVDDWAAVPAGARPLPNPEGLCPGFVIQNVYAFPGIPDEMQAIFETVADDFAGDAVTRVLETTQPEGSVSDVVATVRERYAVEVGSYPSLTAYNRLKVRGTDAETVEEAAAWLRERIEQPD
ncbi:MAG: competence/damage-inducible protein A [Salinirussus sp.]